MNADHREICRRIQDEIFEAVDAGEPLGAELREHLAGCDDCREHHRRLVQVVRSLADQAGPVQPLPEGLAEKVLAAAEKRTEKRGQEPFLAADAQPVRGKRRIVFRLVRPLAAAAAAVLLIAGAWWLLQPPRTTDDTIQDKANPLTDTVDMTQDLVGQMAQLTADPLVDEMDRVMADAEQLGDELLASVPVELIPGVDQGLVRSFLAGPTRRPTPTTQQQ